MSRYRKKILKLKSIQWMRADKKGESATRTWLRELLGTPAPRHFRKRLPAGVDLGNVWQQVREMANVDLDDSVQRNIAAAVEVEVLLERHRVRSDLSAEAWQQIVQIRFEAAVAQWTFEREFDKFRGFVTAGAKGHVILDPSSD